MPDSLRLGGMILPLGGVTHVMGVVNLSPDSRNIHTVAGGVEEALAMAERYRDWGALLIDVGGQSSHPDNPTIEAEEEISRVVPVIEALSAEGHLVSVDTWKAEVAEAALRAGAVMVNDTGGLRSPEMREVIARHGAAAVAVYVEGENPHAVGTVEIREDKAEVTALRLADLVTELSAMGIDQVIIDPGIAINYRGDYQAYSRMQLQVIAGSQHLRRLGRPILIPIPRKKEEHRVAVYIGLALEHQADFIRVHDVEMACDLVELFGRAWRLP